MISLRLYYLWFFIICLVSTLVAGVLAAILPNNIAGVLTAIPYLIAIIFVLFKFLKQSGYDAVFVDVYLLRRRHLRQAGHGHDVPSQGDDEARSSVDLQLPDIDREAIRRA